MHFALGLCAAACLLALATPAAAQEDILTTPSLLQGCEALTENAPTASEMQMGACAGSVAAALAIGQAQNLVCMPGDGNVVGAARIVVNFIYERAERRAQPFGPVALSALQARWPCSQ
jgi:hypothetical protein